MNTGPGFISEDLKEKQSFELRIQCLLFCHCLIKHKCWQALEEKITVSFSAIGSGTRREQRDNSDCSVADDFDKIMKLISEFTFKVNQGGSSKFTGYKCFLY